MISSDMALLDSALKQLAPLLGNNVKAEAVKLTTENSTRITAYLDFKLEHCDMLRLSRTPHEFFEYVLNTFGDSPFGRLLEARIEETVRNEAARAKELDKTVTELREKVQELTRYEGYYELTMRAKSKEVGD